MNVLAFLQERTVCVCMHCTCAFNFSEWTEVLVFSLFVSFFLSLFLSVSLFSLSLLHCLTWSLVAFSLVILLSHLFFFEGDRPITLNLETLGVSQR